VAEGPWAADFSFAYYRRLLTAVRQHWTPHLFRDAGEALARGERAFFLRHDVDVSLERALHIAAAEHEIGFATTYMVMNRGLLYSLHWSGSHRILKQISAMGHEIGVHLEHPDPYHPTEKLPVEILERRIRAASVELEDVLGAPVASFAVHRPTPAAMRGPLMLGGRVNASAAELMHRYLSDSKGSWREGEPLAVIAGATDVPVLQVLVHPIWWGEHHLPALERLSEFRTERVAGLDGEARRRFDADLAATLPGVVLPPHAA